MSHRDAQCIARCRIMDALSVGDVVVIIQKARKCTIVGSEFGEVRTSAG